MVSPAENDLDRVSRKFSAEDGSAWIESKVEYHQPYGEMPVFILLYEDGILAEAGRAAANVIDSVQPLGSNVKLTISFQMANDTDCVIVGHEEGPALQDKLRSIEPFSHPIAFPKEGAYLFTAPRSVAKSR